MLLLVSLFTSGVQASQGGYSWDVRRPSIPGCIFPSVPNPTQPSPYNPSWLMHPNIGPRNFPGFGPGRTS